MSSAQEESGGVRSVIAERYTLRRVAMREHLEAHGFDVVGEAADGFTAVDLAGRARPDLVCLDLELPGLDGIVATRRIRAHQVTAQVLICTDSADDDRLVDALAAGASGCVLKTDPLERLSDALTRAAQGDVVFPERAAAALRRRLGAKAGVHERAADLERLLSIRELEVLGHMADGCDNPAIAARLLISTETVKKHVSHILLKLGLENRVQAAVLAVRDGRARSAPMAAGARRVNAVGGTPAAPGSKPVPNSARAAPVTEHLSGSASRAQRNSPSGT